MLSITINLPSEGQYDITLTVQGAALLTAIDSRLTSIEGQLTAIQQQGAQLIMANAENNALLDSILAALDRLATSEEAQTAAITEIGSDLDALIAETTDPTLRARLEDLKTKAEAAAGRSEAQSESLSMLAAKHPVPPVEPPPA
jgi:chromosome segregation ATPase